IVPLFESRSDAESKSGTSHKTLAMTSLNSRFEGSGSPHDARSAPPGICVSGYSKKRRFIASHFTSAYFIENLIGINYTDKP
ncbi:MAG: hypothetical protein NTZ35_11185, partial [Ignavibacteriales bacterium]|nr:hypothetical protein [Ignavibacteriales bacterium]